MSRPVAIYEKALPGAAWPELFRHAARCGYAAVELAVDESAERIARLAWTREQRADVARAAADAGVSIATVTLSAHRAAPLGSADPATRARSRAMLADAVALAVDLGASAVQVAGYFTYYEPDHDGARNWFLDGLAEGCGLAEREGIVLALENVDGTDVTGVDDGLSILADVGSRALRLYLDVGNLAGNRRDVVADLSAGLPHAHAVQLKEARPGEFRRVAFGAGTVPWPDVVRLLAATRYDGLLGVEMWNDDGDPELPRAALAWFRELEAEVQRLPSR
ncbi:L-ribulose-5-phosphate 3-epimerase [Actinophytocola sp. NPDC049390]|uniref:L-ribulose-5-phosphate 3-epimerase n=1 Tax=Actinophytocola sp. NPDC049390 TaxID=3363894 RepID=UPI0037AD61E9